MRDLVGAPEGIASAPAESRYTIIVKISESHTPGLADTLPEAGGAATRSVAEALNSGCRHYLLSDDLDRLNQNSVEFDTRLKELERAEATYSDACGDRALVKKDLGCAYAGVEVIPGEAFLGDSRRLYQSQRPHIYAIEKAPIAHAVELPKSRLA